eukprot:scaffold125703_cov23-Tisochrysis_lutea.AAC.1
MDENKDKEVAMNLNGRREMSPTCIAARCAAIIWWPKADRSAPLNARCLFPLEGQNEDGL